MGLSVAAAGIAFRLSGGNLSHPDLRTLLFPLAAAKRALERKKGLAPEDASDLRPLHPVADAIMGAVLGLEARLVPRIALPFGLSLFCVAKKV